MAPLRITGPLVSLSENIRLFTIWSFTAQRYCFFCKYANKNRPDGGFFDLTGIFQRRNNGTSLGGSQVCFC
jgi:hypothetical protein